MKKIFAIPLLSMLFIISKAQPVLYGLTSNGGGNGTISRYEAASNTLSASFNFPDPGSRPQGSLLQAGNGKFYGMTQGGGTSNLGTIFSFDPILSVYTKLFDFNGANGSSPQGSLMAANNGKLYGMTGSGGVNNLGVIFSFDPATSAFIKIKDFDELSGNRPGGSLLQATDGKLYGLTYTGGYTGGGLGTIFSLDPITGVYTKLKVFDFINGAYPVNSLIQATDGKLYGMTTGGGAIGGIRLGYGVIFSFDPSTSIYTKLKDFDGVNGGVPTGNLVQASNGKLYGITPTGTKADGSNGDFDVLFSFDPATLTYTKLRNFAGIDGDSPYGSLLQASDGNLYGMTNLGGSTNGGVVFSFNPSTAIYSKLQDFNGSNGRNPFYGTLIELSTITSTALSNTNYCQGAALTVAYTANGLFKPGNTFTAQLSDANGSFSNPVNIGALSSTASGTINAVLPVAAVSGSGYRIRVVADLPATAGSDNGSNITINALPAVYLAPYGDVCIADPAFTLTGGAPAGGVYSGKGVTNNQFNPAAVGAGKYTITYTFKNSAGCTASTKQPITVEKTCNTCKAVITTSGPTTFCAGGKVTLYASSGVSYLWSNGATTQKITVSTTGSYSVKITDANKCTANSMPVAITVNELPATPVITAGGNTSFCIPGSVTLTTGAADSYLWSNGAKTQTITASSSGIYTVTVANAAGCTAVSAGITVNAQKCHLYCAVNGISGNLGYIQNVATDNGINNSSGWNNGYSDFTAISGKSLPNSRFGITISPGFMAGSNKLYTSVWIDWNQNGDFNDAGDLVFAPAGPSDFDQTTTVVVPKTAAPGNTTMRIMMSIEPATAYCGSFKYGEVEDYTIVIPPSGARLASLTANENENQLAGSSDVRVFPNPAANQLQVEQLAGKFQLTGGANTLLLTDINGKILLQTKLSRPRQFIDVSRFSNGIYFLHIKNSFTSSIKKIFIQH